MARRSRHEASWSHPDATVRGSRRRNGWWILLVAAALIVGASMWGFNRYMGFQDVTFQLRTCEKPLDEASTWSEVDAAGCTPTAPAGSVLTVWIDGDQRATKTTADGWVYEGLPVNYPAVALHLDTAEPATSVAVVDVAAQQVRRGLDGDVEGTRWSGLLGDRGGTEYWILVTPQP